VPRARSLSTTPQGASTYLLSWDRQRDSTGPVWYLQQRSAARERHSRCQSPSPFATPALHWQPSSYLARHRLARRSRWHKLITGHISEHSPGRLPCCQCREHLCALELEDASTDGAQHHLCDVVTNRKLLLHPRRRFSRPFLIIMICQCAAESPAGPGPACRCPGPGPADSAHCPGSLSSDSPENETSESAAATAERGRLRCARPWRQCLGRRHHGIGECGSCGCHLRLGH